MALQPVGRFRIARLAPEAALPAWAAGPGFRCIARSERELSIVAPEGEIPATATSQGPFAGFRVPGTLDFSMVGVVASLVEPLAKAAVPVFVVSTYETDYLFVPASEEGRAVAAWRAAGIAMP